MRSMIKYSVFASIAALAALTAADAKTTVETQRGGRTVVHAPGTRVAVLPKRTKVRVEAPYTSVKVDTVENHVRIRVPYFNGDIRW